MDGDLSVVARVYINISICVGSLAPRGPAVKRMVAGVYCTSARNEGSGLLVSAHGATDVIELPTPLCRPQKWSS